MITEIRTIENSQIVNIIKPKNENEIKDLLLTNECLHYANFNELHSIIKDICVSESKNNLKNKVLVNAIRELCQFGNINAIQQKYLGSYGNLKDTKLRTILNANFKKLTTSIRYSHKSKAKFETRKLNDHILQNMIKNKTLTVEFYNTDVRVNTKTWFLVNPQELYTPLDKLNYENFQSMNDDNSNDIIESMHYAISQIKPISKPIETLDIFCDKCENAIYGNSLKRGYCNQCYNQTIKLLFESISLIV